MSDIPVGVQTAEEHVAAAEAELASALRQQTAQAAAQVAPGVPAGTVSLFAEPWHVFDPGGGLPKVTASGSDVPANVAPMILAAAAAAGVKLREG